ncbi:hypothetical protein IFR04_016166 [Cadophora malorum]|uniref:Uncharacterized protein n=1 Tax=Cadophora malorum TaxID=108018 RepID=A0A8H7T1S4_9HELO|nr:hypothetical protein IFR04_016166 [Cadophora malorum]
MYLLLPLSLLTLFSLDLASAANFIDYNPQPGVQAEFKPFFQALVDAAENPNITTGFTDYFPADGMQTTLTLHCVGAARIQACKEYFLADGRQLVHFPKTTFVANNNATATTYEAHVIKRNIRF